MFDDKLESGKEEIHLLLGHGTPQGDQQVCRCYCDKYAWCQRGPWETQINGLVAQLRKDKNRAQTSDSQERNNVAIWLTPATPGGVSWLDQQCLVAIPILLLLAGLPFIKSCSASAWVSQGLSLSCKWLLIPSHRCACWGMQGSEPNLWEVYIRSYKSVGQDKAGPKEPSPPKQLALSPTPSLWCLELPGSDNQFLWALKVKCCQHLGGC